MKINRLVFVVCISLLFIVNSCSTADTSNTSDKNTDHRTKSYKLNQTPIKSTDQLRPALFVSQINLQNKIVNPNQTSSKASEVTTSSKLSKKSEERLKEINHNLAFYCMKHGNESSFKSEENCFKFTKTILNYC